MKAGESDGLATTQSGRGSARRLELIELGAGIAAAVLSLLTLAAVLLAPLVAVCPVALDARGACPRPVRFASLLQGAVRVDPSVWAAIGLLLLFSLVGAVGAVCDARSTSRVARAATWVGTALAVVGVLAVLGIGGALGQFYVPPMLALGIASAVAGVRRARHHAAQRATRA